MQRTLSIPHFCVYLNERELENVVQRVINLFHFFSSDHPLAESSVSTPSQPTTDSGFRSQVTESAYPTPTPSYQALNTPTSSYLDSSSPTSSYLGTTTPTQSYLGPNTLQGAYVTSDPSPPTSEPRQITLSHGSPRAQHRTNILGHPTLGHPTHNSILQQRPSANQDVSIIMGQQTSPVNGFEVGMVGLSGSPILGHRPSQGAQSSPVLSRQASLAQGSQRSPVLSRQPSLGQPMQSSPVLSRQPSVTHPQGSPVLGRHPSVSQMSQRSPSLDRHPMHSGYNTPDERHGNLSRQSSSSGYQGPPTPSFPISPAGFQDGGMMGMGVGFRQGSPAPGFQPQLPEKRRMSSGDRPNGALSYGTLNGKIVSPASGGSTPSYFHTLSDFSRFNMPGKDTWCENCLLSSSLLLCLLLFLPSWNGLSHSTAIGWLRAQCVGSHLSACVGLLIHLKYSDLKHNGRYCQTAKSLAY